MLVMMPSVEVYYEMRMNAWEVKINGGWASCCAPPAYLPLDGREGRGGGSILAVFPPPALTTPTHFTLMCLVKFNLCLPNNYLFIYIYSLFFEEDGSKDIFSSPCRGRPAYTMAAVHTMSVVMKNHMKYSNSYFIITTWWHNEWRCNAPK